MSSKHLYLLLHAAALLSSSNAATQGTIVTERSVSSTVTTGMSGLSPECDFDGELSIAHPMSLNENDRFFSTGQLQLKAMEMIADYINVQRCGVTLPSGQYSIKLKTYGDDSSKDKVEAIANFTKDDTDFFVGPYSSGLTGKLAPVVQDNNNVLIAGGAASTSVFSNRNGVFGTFPPTNKYMAEAIKALGEQGAKSVATIYESASFTTGVCAAVPGLAGEHGLDVTSQNEVVSSPLEADLEPMVQQMIDEDPDVVVTCVYAEGCTEWIKTMRNANWSPKAQVFTVCLGQSTFEEDVGSDREFMLGVSPWDPSLPVNDTITGWSASEFSDRFLDYTARTATYHAASAAASLAIFVQVMEETNSTDVDTIKSSLAVDTFRTLYGDISFDTNGQSNAPSLVLQYDQMGNVQTVYPEEKRSEPISYPMPTWGFRDCSKGGLCEESGGTCQSSGICSCNTGKLSFSSGLTATCATVPEEDMTKLGSGLKMAGYAVVVMQGLLSTIAIIWTYIYRDNELVKVSQPPFLRAIALGCFVMAATIIPLSIEGDYRYKVDPNTYKLTDEEDPDISSVDSACMALVWLYNMGFIITYSALFAKIWRIKKLFFDTSMRRKKVSATEVGMVMVVLCTLMFVIMISFQLVAPMQWDREVQYSDSNGFTVESVGSCGNQENSDLFLIVLAVFHAFCLLYALLLCFQVRNVPGEFAEAKWISASIFCLVQLMVIALPIVFIVKDNADAFYFVRAGIAFVESFLVTVLMFGPKMHSIYTGDAKKAVSNALGEYQSSQQNKSTVIAPDGES